MLVNFAGAQVGGYTLQAEIGHGGMSRVYRATRPDTTQQFAVKVVNHLTTRDVKFEQRFWREISVVNRLNHPSILPVLASGQEMDGTLYMVMPLIEGGSMKDLLTGQGALSPVQLRAVIDQMTSALDYAHAQGIVHRDIKPHNMMQMDQDRWVLADFGVAAMSSLEETVSNLTSTGATLGTFAYMSPEQIAGSELDGRADFYSLGVVMYQALIGRLPFVGDNTAVVLSQQLHTLPIEPHLISPDFPPEIEAVLMQTLAKRPDNRYQTGAELAAAYNAAFDALPEERRNAPLVSPEEAEGAGTLMNIPVASVTEQPVQDKRLSRRLVLGAIAAVLLAIAACVVIVMPLQAQLAEAQATAAALGSRTPVVVTQMVTNAAGEQVFILVTADADTLSATPGVTKAATTDPRTRTPAPTATPAVTVTAGPTATPVSGDTSGQGGATVGPTSASVPTSVDATAPGNSANAGTPGSGTTNGGGSDGTSTGNGNSTGNSNSGGGNSGGNSGGNGNGNGGGNGNNNP